MTFTVQPIFKTFFLAVDICRFCMVIRFFFPATTANDLRLRRISIPDLSTSYHFFNYLHSWERASICRFQCWVPNKGTTGTIFIMSLVWRSPWLGIKPGTSRFRRQHATTFKHLLVHCSTGFALCFSESLMKVTIPKLTTKDW